MPPKITKKNDSASFEESLKRLTETELRRMLEFDYFLAGTMVYRGVNEKQKSGRPEFFALDERQARQYAKPWMDVFEAQKSCKLVKNDYPIDLDECCLSNAYILMELARRHGCSECETSIRTLMIDDNVTDAFKVDKEIILFICSLGLSGWARMGENASAPEVAFCPGVASSVLKRVRRINVETGEVVNMDGRSHREDIDKREKDPPAKRERRVPRKTKRAKSIKRKLTNKSVGRSLRHSTRRRKTLKTSRS